MISKIHTKKRKAKKLWYGWAVQAGKHFNYSSKTAQNKFRANDLELLTWLQNELLKRKKQNETAKTLKKAISNV
jgi:hypothetical protein